MPFSIEIEASHYSICMLGFLSNKKKMGRLKENELANNMAALCWNTGRPYQINRKGKSDGVMNKEN